MTALRRRENVRQDEISNVPPGPQTSLIERGMTFAHSPLPLAPGTPAPSAAGELQLEKTSVSRGYNAPYRGYSALRLDHWPYNHGNPL